MADSEFNTVELQGRGGGGGRGGRMSHTIMSMGYAVIYSIGVGVVYGVWCMVHDKWPMGMHDPPSEH